MSKPKKQTARNKQQTQAVQDGLATHSSNKPTSAIPNIRLRSISIRNYKGIDALDLEIPKPRSPNDPDILVVGSKNGAGKTSLLEACALVMLAPISGFRRVVVADHFLDYMNYMIRAGETSTTVRGTVEAADNAYDVTITFKRGVRPSIDFDIPKSLDERTRDISHNYEWNFEFEYTLRTLLGFLSDPLLTPLVRYWHSYRRVAPGNIDLSTVMFDNRQGNSFKREVVRALMSKAGLFEGIAIEDAERALEKVNELTQQFARGTIEKLRTTAGNAMDVRISPTKGGPSYSFDGLSSGQKEMISTLFLLWRHTQNQPGLVLIDEPELHLNAEWHAEFVGALFDIAPKNQYILATHSEDVAGAVSPERRVIIESTRS